VEEILSKTFPCDFDEMVVVTDIEATGVCPHHLMPVRYTIHVGYIPSQEGQVLGLSKIPRLVCLLAARPILQEQLTKDIADIFEDNLNPLGVMVVVSGGHSCMQCRGVRMSGSRMITSAIRGVFQDDSAAKQEFLDLARKF
jgi:GTP cyclohydrolase I